MVKGSFKRQVEVGRVVLLPEEGNKLAVIVDIVDHKRAVIDGPTTGVVRQPYSFKRLVLTNLVVKNLPRNAGSKIVKEYVEKNDIVATFEKSAWAQKLKTREIRANLTDFERFKLRKLKAQRRFALRSALKEAKKSVKA